MKICNRLESLILKQAQSEVSQRELIEDVLAEESVPDVDSIKAHIRVLISQGKLAYLDNLNLKMVS
ncbi:MAG: hypothetical protein CMF60_08785 [Magnetococcales bacterium]|nr:hypothetical protein [Magnetococcales bacterium]|tara:strand:- start:1442 stop:1639 length:198 start_codon:yes stop_codon:yes gene_type:complete